MILHVFDSQGNFAKTGITCFETVDLQSHYWVFGARNRLSEVQTKVPIEYLSGENADSQLFIQNNASNYQLILFHGLLNENVWALRILKKMKIASKIGWVIYGAEMSNVRLNPAFYLLPKTKSIYYKLGFYRLGFPLLRFLKRITHTDLKFLMEKVDYAVHFIPQEIDEAESVFEKKFKRLWFSYVILERFVGPDLWDARVVPDGNILIGNSASYTSNHTELFEMLSSSPFVGNREVIVPLSYGSSKYAKSVNHIGERILGNSFKPLNDFIPKSEYDNMLMSCSCVIMNHCRQQALGNIIVALWLGAKVYLRKNISTFKFLKENNIVVFSIEDDLDVQNNNSFLALNSELALKNRNQLILLLGDDTYRSLLMNSFSEFNQQQR